MIEVYPGLFIGNRIDYETLVSGQDGWASLHPCTSYHRMAVGDRVWSVATRHADVSVGVLQRLNIHIEGEHMKAGEIWFLSIINGKKHFVIPIYQRTYSWTYEQCQQLWNDIVQVAIISFASRLRSTGKRMMHRRYD